MEQNILKKLAENVKKAAKVIGAAEETKKELEKSPAKGRVKKPKEE